MFFTAFSPKRSSARVVPFPFPCYPFLFLAVFCVDFLHFEAHLRYPVRVLRRGSIDRVYLIAKYRSKSRSKFNLLAAPYFGDFALKSPLFVSRDSNGPTQLTTGGTTELLVKAKNDAQSPKEFSNQIATRSDSFPRITLVPLFFFHTHRNPNANTPPPPPLSPLGGLMSILLFFGWCLGFIREKKEQRGKMLNNFK